MTPNSSVVVVVFASESVLPMLDNWIAHVHRARIQDALVACFDARACAHAERRRVVTARVECTACNPGRCPSSGKGPPSCRRKFREMMMARLHFALKFVRAGRSIFMSDVDNVFTRPPAPALHALLGGSGVDVAAPLDLWVDWWHWPTSAKPDQNGYLFMQQLNSGAVFFAATRGAAAVLARAISLAESGACDHVPIIDQWALNAAIGGVQPGTWWSHEPTLLCPTPMFRDANVASSAANVTARIALLPGAMFSDTRGSLAHWRYMHEPMRDAYPQRCGGLRDHWRRCARSKDPATEGDVCRYDVIVDHERCRAREQAADPTSALAHQVDNLHQQKQKHKAVWPLCPSTRSAG